MPSEFDRKSDIPWMKRLIHLIHSEYEQEVKFLGGGLPTQLYTVWSLSFAKSKIHINGSFSGVEEWQVLITLTKFIPPKISQLIQACKAGFLAVSAWKPHCLEMTLWKCVMGSSVRVAHSKCSISDNTGWGKITNNQNMFSSPAFIVSTTVL